MTLQRLLEHRVFVDLTKHVADGLLGGVSIDADRSQLAHHTGSSLPLDARSRARHGACDTLIVEGTGGRQARDCLLDGGRFKAPLFQTLGELTCRELAAPQQSQTDGERVLSPAAALPTPRCHCHARLYSVVRSIP
jgi:hypothetical protein